SSTPWRVTGGRRPSRKLPPSVWLRSAPKSDRCDLRLIGQRRLVRRTILAALISSGTIRLLPRLILWRDCAAVSLSVRVGDLMKDQHPPTSSLRADPYRLLIESVTDYAIFMLDRDGIVASWNPGAERLKGYRTTEILGQHFSRFYTDEDRASGLPARALEISAREGRFEHEGWRVRQDGSRFWASVIIDPIRDETGALLGYAKVTRDLTERRDAQRALEATREALFQSQKMEAVG